MYPQKPSALVIVDIQERLVAAMQKDEISAAIKKCEILLSSCAILGVPAIFTEQYPKGLGCTVPELKKYLPSSGFLCEKSAFSCFGSEEFAGKIREMKLSSIIITGIETHVCVQQTAFDALSEGLSVFIPYDAVSSRKDNDKQCALRLMSSAGITVTGTESLLFSLLKDSAHPHFKEISKLLK